MVGYRLNNTLSDSGSVSRGVCEVENGYLKGVVERKEIKRLNGEVIVSDDGTNWTSIDEKRLVSMNFWGFTPKIFELAERQFIEFLKRELEKNPLKCEHVIPTMVGETLNEGLYTIEALPSENTWFGVTYQEDKPYVVKQFVDFKEKGEYPFDLWKE